MAAEPNGVSAHGRRIATFFTKLATRVVVPAVTELEAARADAARLGEALKEMAVKLMLVEGKGRWG